MVSHSSFSGLLTIQLETETPTEYSEAVDATDNMSTRQHNIMQVNDCMNSKGAEQLQHSWTSHRGENEILATIMTDVFGDKLSAS